MERRVVNKNSMMNELRNIFFVSSCQNESLISQKQPNL